jgi:hypothetical protein
MKAGGKLLQQERDEQRKHIEEREQEREKRRVQSQPATGGVYGDDSSFDLFGGTLRHTDPDLFTIVSKAISFFMR